MYSVNMYIIYISRTCTLKLLTLAAARFHFSSARHPCCTPVQRRFALHGWCSCTSFALPTGYHVKLPTQLQTCLAGPTSYS